MKKTYLAPAIKNRNMDASELLQSSVTGTTVTSQKDAKDTYTVLGKSHSVWDSEDQPSSDDAWQ